MRGSNHTILSLSTNLSHNVGYKWPRNLPSCRMLAAFLPVRQRRLFLHDEVFRYAFELLEIGDDQRAALTFHALRLAQRADAIRDGVHVHAKHFGQLIVGKRHDGDVLYQATGTFPRTRLAFRPMLCNHCEDPASDISQESYWAIALGIVIVVDLVISWRSGRVLRQAGGEDGCGCRACPDVCQRGRCPLRVLRDGRRRVTAKRGRVVFAPTSRDNVCPPP